MIRCLIIDDEKAAIEVIKHHVHKTPFLELVGCLNNAIEGIKMVNDNKVDLVFLDIRMPKMNGLEFAKSVNGRTRIILTSAHSQYAYEGFELDVIDYLLKPVEYSRFVKAVNKANDILNLTNIKRMGDTDKDGYIYVRSEGQVVRITFTEIEYIESFKQYVEIHYCKHSAIVLSSLKELEEILPTPKFLRVHRSFIISTDKIKAIVDNQVILRDLDLAIPIGDAYREEFLAIIRPRSL